MHISKMTFKEGAELTISLRLNCDGTRFTIDIGHDSQNIALHVSPWFDASVIVSFNFNKEHFFIKLPDGNTIIFPNRPGDVEYNYLEIREDATMLSYKMTF
ncbi:hypothetical protein CRUP_002290 [Coryphaenoides rupestris]|nr:hypothetical protein CRUP_002290 [Coryphaenoides rupestris]